jgi:hypothetical protein
MVQVTCGQIVTMDLPASNPSPVHVGFVIDYLTMGQNFLRLVHIAPVSTSLPRLQSHSFIYHRRYMIITNQNDAE